MSDILARSVRSLSSAEGNRELDCALRALEFATGKSYISCLELVQSGCTAAGWDCTLHDAISASGVNPDGDLASDISTFERLGNARRELEQRADRALRTLDSSGEGDSQGAVPIDDRTYSDVRSAHPSPSWTRLRRAQRLPGGAAFSSPEGERDWADIDRTRALAGEDILATREREQRQAALRNVAAAHAGQLERAVQSGTDELGAPALAGSRREERLQAVGRCD